MNKKIIIAGGGTGGHIFPAIAIANAIKALEPNTEFLFVGATGKMEMEKVPQAGYKIEGITIAGLNRSSLIKNIGLPLKLIKSFFQVRQIFKSFTPDAVIGVGGYATLPVLRLAQAKGIPTFIHESNSFAGKANLYLAKNATKIFVASEGMEKFFPSDKLMITGNPVRKAIAQASVSKEEALKHFGLQANKQTVLAIGGSLGAKSINDALALNLDAFKMNNLQLIWQTGKPNADYYHDKAKGMDNIWVDSFINEMDKAYAAADLVISRAGAMSITEICVAGKAAIFVPYPHAAEDHQTHNANALVKKQAAFMIKDADVKTLLLNKTIQLAKDQVSIHLFEKNSRAMAIDNADILIAKTILNTIK
ncbi:MAG: undecaprenyldiphospho-muramoylpentapeptide beta-N-acetylglucosaminyltransferase [Bacteroidetes bacterium 24-39-8]|jgi:UDP-N-acetylglucosamine--N-acetylmuramyl-(pentapeptide) pyrophosphoryl-undecaprenol N-acetylglucosamine transferase|nr:MAG: undecaprenyldiphospho-muramoylpentapeptide beta-N-acetylglucosaminyltransferase [Bacteroidetes bacterium 24-39-8]OZA65514.1 MAG: undecaprenyldiphospho-muramoylpentapeptide beta-N-acetylglucosaminyltransferase [Sphingobacteriia bacterium 39-39-8]HQR92062.1 undecaprenyldiphospho-muramoylpentapeptide beta-N-acetylglucosaminyltransferase [Sediminibacterium sp.]HQS54673.1 undecaprenyldiphospho-muramoylpentapeptide beta-N-acetylglucosaminyltransferase [Sediminibacterium sp.]